VGVGLGESSAVSGLSGHINFTLQGDGHERA
jgi:hypothetical protein